MDEKSDPMAASLANLSAFDEAMTIASDLYTDNELVLWLNSPQPLLDNLTPVQLFILGRSEELARVMRAIDDGVYT